MPQHSSRPLPAFGQPRLSQYATHVCVDCGAQMRPRKITPGSFLIEIVLWLLLLLPGLIYSVWRISSAYEGCPVCGGRSCVVLTTPAARAILERFKSSKVASPEVSEENSH
jgi:hypothetical protein